MKNNTNSTVTTLNTAFSILIGLVIVTCIAGCSALQSAPPTKVESALYNVVTNYATNTVTVTNQTTVTNFVPIVVTNIVAGQPVVVTNTITVTNPGPPVVTTITTTNAAQQFTTAPATAATIQAVGAGVDAFVPGIGTIIASAAAGLIGLWGTLRSKQANTAQAVAANSVQAIEVARNLVASLAPNAASQFNAWLVAHQQDAGIANEVAQIVDQIVNTNLGQAAGQGAAQQILTAATAPLPVYTPATPKT